MDTAINLCKDRLQKEEMTAFQLEELIAVAAENSPVSNKVCKLHHACEIIPVALLTHSRLSSLVLIGLIVCPGPGCARGARSLR